MELNLKKELKVAIKAAKEAGEILSRSFGKDCRQTFKADFSPSIKADFLAEEKILSVLQKAFPKYQILSEESGEHGKSDFCWVIDPLDGTSNYLRGIPIFGVSIALLFRDETKLGVIYLPPTDELFWVQKGKGAYLNGKKIHASKANELKKTVTCLEWGRGEEDRKFFGRILAKLLPTTGTTKHLGSSVYNFSMLARGRIDAILDQGSQIWDRAAGLLLVEEAGGKVTDLKGEKWSFDSWGFLATNGTKIHEEILKIING
jgi:myo-inositol-1(or 4)-monophosphatase